MRIIDAITGRAPDVEELLNTNGYERAAPSSYSDDRALTAASRRIDLSNPDDAREAADAPWRSWQLDAWDQFEAIGEINYGYEMLGAVMSRLRLYPAIVLDPDGPPSSVSQIQRHLRGQEASDEEAPQGGEMVTDAVEDALGTRDIPEDLTDEVMMYMTSLITELGSGYGGLSGLLRMFALNVSIPGECYLALINKRWSIRSTSEIRVMSSTEQAILTESRISRSANGQPWVYLPKDTPLIRIWRQHPRYCVDDQTEILTRVGWKYHDDLIDGDEALTLNHESGVAQWQEISKIHRYDVVDEPMVSVESTLHSSLTTANHRWPILTKGDERQWTTSDMFRQGQRIITNAPLVGLSSEPKWKDEFVELLGWYHTEGSVAGDVRDRRIEELTDPQGWKQWFRTTRYRTGLSLEQIGNAFGIFEKKKAQQFAADACRRGVARRQNRERLAEIFEVGPSEPHGFYRSIKAGRQVVIHQSHRVNPHFCDRIRRVLTTLYGPRTNERVSTGGSFELADPQWREYRDETKGMTTFALNTAASEPLLEVAPRKDKVIDLDFIRDLTFAQLNLFIQTSLDADGAPNQKPRRSTWGVPCRFGQMVPGRVDAVELACILAGRSVTRKTKSNGMTWLTIRDRPTVRMSENQTHPQAERYTGVTWCPETPNGTWFARRNGKSYFTGNSKEPISSIMSVLESCHELRAIQQMVRGVARSRMNAGFLFIPDDLRVAGQSVDKDIEATEDETEDLIDEMFDAITVPITNETAGTSAVPLTITGPRESGEAIRHITFERQSDQWLIKRADDVLIRVLNGLNFPKEKVEGLSAVRYCVDDQTEILTREGWKTYDQVAVGDEVLTLNRDTETSEWQALEEVSTFDIDEPVLEVSRRGHHSVSTLDHRWHVRRQTSRNGKAHYDRQIVRSSELATGHFIPIAAPSADRPTEAKYSDAFVELVAWFFTEGYVKTKGRRVHDTCVDREGFVAWLGVQRRACGLSRSELGFRMGDYANRNSASGSMLHLERAGAVDRRTRHRLADVLGVDYAEVDAFFRPGEGLLSHIVLTQSESANPGCVARIRAALTSLCGPAGVVRESFMTTRTDRPHWSESGDGVRHFYLNGAAAAAIIDVCHGKDKVVDLDFIHELTAAQLELFIRTAIDADGHWIGGSAEIVQVVPERLDALELACILSGRAVHRYTLDNGTPVLKIKTRMWAHPMGHGSSGSVRPYQGIVWCPTVPNGTWLARRSGTVYFTMNTNAEVVDEDLYRIHVEPLAVMLCDAITTSYFRYRIRQKFPDLSEHTLTRLVTWYDPSNIIIKTDPAESANAGYDRNLISGTAWRRRHGFGETDAPSQAEIALRTVIDQVGKNLLPQEQSYLLRQVFPALFGESRSELPGGTPLPAQQPVQDDRFGPDDAMTAEQSDENTGSDDESAQMS